MRRTREEAPATDMEAEGLPDTEDQPPGIDIENAVEGMIPPRDHPVGADQWGTTAAEEARGEPLADRVRREQPDVARADQRPVGRLVAPDAGTGRDDEGTEVAEEERDDTLGLSAEEAAMHIEPPG
jgi:hypothetical protein